MTCDVSLRYRRRSRYAVGRIVFVDRRILTRFAFDSEQLVFLGILLDELDLGTYQGGLFESFLSLRWLATNGGPPEIIAGVIETTRRD